MSFTNIIARAKLSQIISNLGKNNGMLYTMGQPNNLTRLLYCVRKDIERIYELDPSEESLTATTNYLQSLCVAYGLPVREIQGGGGGIAHIVSGIILPSPYDFEVTGSSFIIAGQSQKTINAFIGYNITFDRNNIPQSTVNMGGSYFSWNPSTGNFQVFPEAGSGELFTITPV